MFCCVESTSFFLKKNIKPEKKIYSLNCFRSLLFFRDRIESHPSLPFFLFLPRKHITIHNLIPPSDDPEFASLGEWVKNVRRGNVRRLAAADRQKLNQLGFVWETRANRFDREWKQQFDKLAAYKARRGDCLVPWQWSEDVKLAEWVHTQRKFNSKGTLRADRRRLLDDLGFVWWRGSKPKTSNSSNTTHSNGNSNNSNQKNNQNDTDGEKEGDTIDTNHQFNNNVVHKNDDGAVNDHAKDINPRVNNNDSGNNIEELDADVPQELRDAGVYSPSAASATV